MADQVTSRDPQQPILRDIFNRSVTLPGGIHADVFDAEADDEGGGDDFGDLFDELN